MSVFVTFKINCWLIFGNWIWDCLYCAKNFLAYFARYFCLAKEKEEKCDG